jgi:hypothetical protein
MTIDLKWLLPFVMPLWLLGLARAVWFAGGVELASRSFHTSG